jgi:hypothetical protein
MYYTENQPLMHYCENEYGYLLYAARMLPAIVFSFISQLLLIAEKQVP